VIGNKRVHRPRDRDDSRELDPVEMNGDEDALRIVGDLAKRIGRFHMRI
jgi:hypothetical protein